jgi:hypothetical protein
MTANCWDLKPNAQRLGARLGLPEVGVEDPLGIVRLAPDARAGKTRNDLFEQWQ